MGCHALLQGVFPTQEPRFPTLQADSLPSELPGKPELPNPAFLTTLGMLVAQSCPTLCDPMDCSLPGFPVHGILWAKILEQVAIPFSRGSS